MADTKDPVVRHNEADHRFELEIEGRTAFLQYRLPKAGDSISLLHTEVPAELEGHGMGGKLAQAALEFARAAHLKVIPLCPFVAAYIRRHPEYLELVAEKYKDRVISR